jgi:hypothetical protein
MGGKGVPGMVWPKTFEVTNSKALVASKLQIECV